MNVEDKNNVLKIVFGLIIFLFSLALAYFTAIYVDKNTQITYWATLLMFAGGYLVVGLVVSKIYPISLGFLFSADILLLNVLFENFRDLEDITKAVIVGIILVVLYAIVFLLFPDDDPDNISLISKSQQQSPPQSPIDPVVPTQ